MIVNRSHLGAIRDEAGALPAYAWPGAYPMIYYTVGGLAVCPACANEADTSDPVADGETYDEGPTVPCDDCGKLIESSYGDPEVAEA